MDADYYSAVYTWFEKCGIISKVRTHLRSNLVNALKSKDTTLNKNNTVPKSAKQYVYDLLVAEYLWDHNYAYTLSVFASEAPLLVNFFKRLPGSESPGGKEKLQADYVRHALETVGISPEDKAGLSIVQEYTDNDTPLLLCILKCASLSVGKGASTACRRDDTHDCQTQTNGGYRGSVEYSKLVAAKRKLLQQKEAFAAELKRKEDELKRQAGVMEEHMTMLGDQLAKAQSLMRAVNQKEKKLLEERKEEDRRVYRREIELSTKEEMLAREAERLQKERDGYRKFESDLKKLQDELTKVRSELPTREKDRNSSLRDVRVQTEFVDGEKLALCRERDELTSLVKVQQSRIEELTKRTVSLARQLEEAQLAKRIAAEIPSTSVVRFSKASTTLLSESSSTEDILQDARMRLRRLEEESLRADQCYFNCIATSPL